MDNKKFDELMKIYVSSTNSSATKDFAKLKMQDKKPYTHKMVFPRYAWAVLSTILIFVISIAVFLPLYFGKDKTEAPNEGPEVPDTQYFDDEELLFKPVSSIEDFNSAYELNVMKPAIEANMGETISIICSKGDENEILGIYAELLVYDEFIREIYFYAIFDGYTVSSLASFNTFELYTIWKEWKVYYYIESIGGSYNYQLKFKNGSITYYIEIYRDNEIEILDLLDNIFEKPLISIKPPNPTEPTNPEEPSNPAVPSEPKQPETPDVQYYDEGELAYSPVSSIAEINATYEFNIMQPTIENMGEDISIICNDESTVLGVKIRLDVYDEYTDNIIIYGVLNQYAINDLAKFDSYELSTVWNGHEVFCYINEFVGSYNLKFEADDIVYYLEVFAVEDIAITDLLDMIFS